MLICFWFVKLKFYLSLLNSTWVFRLKRKVSTLFSNEAFFKQHSIATLGEKDKLEGKRQFCS
jgi:hypothetical protein